jgi:hypothetical protein
MARPAPNYQKTMAQALRWQRTKNMDWFGRECDDFDDDYFVELREALEDPTPLGPRDEPAVQPEPVVFLSAPSDEPVTGRTPAPAPAPAPARRRHMIRATQWIRNAAALVFAFDVMVVARHL